MYLAGNYCYRINAVAPPGVLTQVTRNNPSKPNETQQNGEKSRGYIVLSGVMSRSKELKIPRSLRACRFKSGPGDHISDLEVLAARLHAKRDEQCPLNESIA
jgi:hypothetical protein